MSPFEATVGSSWPGYIDRFHQDFGRMIELVSLLLVAGAPFQAAKEVVPKLMDNDEQCFDQLWRFLIELNERLADEFFQIVVVEFQGFEQFVCR